MYEDGHCVTKVKLSQAGTSFIQQADMLLEEMQPAPRSLYLPMPIRICTGAYTYMYRCIYVYVPVHIRICTGAWVLTNDGMFK